MSGSAGLDDLWSTPELGRWTAGDEIGAGGMGRVYRAVERATGEARAIKLILPEIAQQATMTALFRREMLICEALRHRNLVRTYATGEAHDVCFVVMEYCTGGTLADLVARQGPLAPEIAIPLILQILDGLTYAHTASLRAKDAQGTLLPVVGVVHRDIKPQNILLQPATDGGPPVVKIADFGLAKAFEISGLSKLSKDGEARGSPPFMPRSQMTNYKYARPEVDVWATAATLYFALTARTPRDFRAGRDPWRTILEDPPVPIGTRGVPLPQRLRAALDRALDDSPDTWPVIETAAELRQVLEPAIAPT